MKTRSSLEICLPLFVFAVACLVSLPTLILALVWLTLGACSIGHHSLEELPTDGIQRQWLHGPRSICLWFYHLAWWPRYMRVELREIAARAGEAIESAYRRAGRKGAPRASRRRAAGDDK
ncbi:hypothetical protein R70006_07398 [Paraburkholderia domus]|jgi:hypothetical protein|nr:hypothetical protein R70006_07398 [Paraburkholderia domus]